MFWNMRSKLRSSRPSLQHVFAATADSVRSLPRGIHKLSKSLEVQKRELGSRLKSVTSVRACSFDMHSPLLNALGRRSRLAGVRKQLFGK